MQLIQKIEKRNLFPLLIIGIGIILGIILSHVEAQRMLFFIFGLVILFFILSIKIDHKVLSLILILASYINLVKPIFGTRYAPILIDLIVALLFIRIFLNKAILKETPFSQSIVIEIPLLLFFLICSIQLFNPNVPTLQAGLEGFRKTTYQMLAIFLGIYYIKDQREVEKVGKYICYASIPILLYGIKQFFFFSAFDQKIIDLNLGGRAVYHIAGATRAISIFSGPFHFGMFSCLVALLSLYFYLKRRRFFYLVLVMFSVMGVFFSMTRTNIVALVVSGLFFLWFAKPERRRLLKKVNIFFFLSLLILIIVSSGKFAPVTSVFKSLKNISEDQRFLNRFIGYRNMSKAFVEQPIMGYGMGSAGDTLEKRYSWRTHFTSHNLGFKILIETGLVGLGIYIFFFLSWFKKAFNLSKTKDSNIKNLSVLIISIVLILLVNGLVGSAVEAYPINLYTWFFMGALIKIWFMEKKQRDEKAHENT